jgi:hypothetical protein
VVSFDRIPLLHRELAKASISKDLICNVFATRSTLGISSGVVAYDTNRCRWTDRTSAMDDSISSNDYTHDIMQSTQGKGGACPSGIKFKSSIRRVQFCTEPPHEQHAATVTASGMRSNTKTPTTLQVCYNDATATS